MIRPGPALKFSSEHFHQAYTGCLPRGTKGHKICGHVGMVIILTVVLISHVRMCGKTLGASNYASVQFFMCYSSYLRITVMKISVFFKVREIL